ncbi:serine/threonine-protein phosphatase PGAM5, mitochondrial-like protein [Camelus ferus]|nr:serine/threonine-protein phosphatase PGAM5, mitochondrial-like protein [Camelus ferus]
MIEKKQKKENCSQKLDVSGPLRYAIFGFFFTGPLSHFFFVFMEHWIPSEVPLVGVKRLLLDRFLFAPAFLLLFFLVMNFLEGKDAAAFAAKMKSGFWPALQTNWRVWTPVQFININYVPLQFRVLFANVVALFWREPLSLVNLRKRSLEPGEEELASRLDHYKAKATRHIFLIRHSQYHVDASLEKDRTLTPLGREQAELTGLRLASLGLKFNKIVHSSMTRAVETTDIISKHLPGVCRVSTDLLREGAPIEPDPPVSHWKPEAVQYYEDGARIEAAFRNYIHRADAKQQEDSYEIFICHANVIRYIVCRALQFPPEGWLRLSLNNGSITHLVVRPDGRVALRALGDTGFMPPDKISRS